MRKVMSTQKKMDIDEPCKNDERVGRLSLYFKTKRGLSIPRLYQYLQKASREDVTDTFVSVFHLRDCRGGKGERSLGIRAMQWLFLSYPKQFMRVARLVPEYGRWDDLMHLWPRVLNLESAIPSPSAEQQQQWRDHLNRNFYVNIKSEKALKRRQRLQKEIVLLTGDQLKKDRKMMGNSAKVSLCAKWAPTEKDSLDQEYNTVKELCEAMSIRQAQYRKLYTSPLREYLQITETLMCRKDWEKIDFNTVPSRAMKNLKKAFEKHTPETLYEWRSKLSTQETKVNANHVLPHELICEIVAKGGADPVCQAQWTSLEEQVEDSGVFSDTLVVVDTSVSMKEWKDNKFSFTPMDIAIGMGILISSGVESSVFRNRVISFSNLPMFVEFKSDDIHDRYLALRNSNWAGKMDLEATLDLILERAKGESVDPNDLPQKLLIISDMDFNKAGGSATNFRAVDARYKAAGYKRPIIVFWNICVDDGDFSVSSRSDGAMLISGFYPCIVQAMLAGDSPDPWSIARGTLDSDRYVEIRSEISAFE